MEAVDLTADPLCVLNKHTLCDLYVDHLPGHPEFFYCLLNNTADIAGYKINDGEIE